MPTLGGVPNLRFHLKSKLVDVIFEPNFPLAAQMGKNNAGYEELLVVMEWCPCAVPDLLKDRGGCLNRQETTKVMYQTCSALSALHKLQPPHIHRDIKERDF